MTRVEIDGLRLASLNAREHWSAKQRRVRDERAWSRVAIRAAGIRAIGPDETACIVIVRRGRRALDDDNLVGACKHVRDGVADALGIDDADPRVTWICDQAPATSYGVAIEVTFGDRTRSIRSV